MSTAQPHIIRRQFLHVEVQGVEADGLAVQRGLPGLCHGALATALESSMSAALAAGEHLLIERLEIDAGTFALDRLEHDLAGAVSAALQKALRDLGASAEARRRTSAQSAQEAFFHFLATGHLPWWFHLPSGQTLEEAVVASWGAQGDTASTQPAFARALAEASRSGTARRRLALQFSLSFLAESLIALRPEGGNDWILALIDKDDAALPGSVMRFLRQVFETAFASMASGRSASRETLLAECWHELPETSRQEPELLAYLEQHAPWMSRATVDGTDIASTPLAAQATRMPGRQQSRPSEVEPIVPAVVMRFLDRVNEVTLARGQAASHDAILLECWHGLPELDRQDAELRAYLGRHAPQVLRMAGTQESAGTALKSGETDGGPKNAEARNTPDMDVPAKTSGADDVPGPAETHNMAKREKSNKVPGPVLKEGVYVAQAGLVLLHPFLPRLFEALDIAHGAELVAPERALCLLHFLATGQRAAPEYELALPKLLCNVPMESPVDTLAGPTIDEQQEAAALLNAVIGHWDALRDTTVDGLRSAFLMRAGKLAQREDGDYLLQVEAKSLDILLDQLPWGFGTIKLPWMSKILWVEWR